MNDFAVLNISYQACHTSTVYIVVVSLRLFISLHKKQGYVTTEIYTINIEFVHANILLEQRNKLCTEAWDNIAILFWREKQHINIYDRLHKVIIKGLMQYTIRHKPPIHNFFFQIEYCNGLRNHVFIYRLRNTMFTFKQNKSVTLLKLLKRSSYGIIHVVKCLNGLLTPRKSLWKYWLGLKVEVLRFKQSKFRDYIKIEI